MMRIFSTLLLATCTQTALAATLTVDSLLEDGFFNDSNPGDGDEGAYRRMKHSEFAEADPTPGAFPTETVVTFSVDSDPTNQAYPTTVDFYRANGYGERQGTAFLDSPTFDAFGTEETITLKLPAGIGIERHFTALATDADGNISEFAPARSLGETIFLDSYED